MRGLPDAGKGGIASFPGKLGVKGLRGLFARENHGEGPGSSSDRPRATAEGKRKKRMRERGPRIEGKNIPALKVIRNIREEVRLAGKGDPIRS